jgi:putative tricarboxylic transport membrane protein
MGFSSEGQGGSADAGGGGDEAQGRGAGERFGRLPPDLLVGAAILAFCAAAYAVTLTFAKAPAVVAQNVQPATFPRLVIGVIAVLTIAMMALASQAPRLAGLARTAPMTWLTALVMIAFVLAFEWLGIVPAMMLLCLGLPALWGERRWHVIVPFALAFPAMVYFLFAEVLDVHFEPSPLIFW